MVGWPRLAFGLQRFELAALATGTLVWAGLALLVAAQLDAVASAHPGCFAPETYDAACERVLREMSGWRDLGDMLLRVAWGAPFVTGLVLATPIVAREVEHRTGLLAWSLSPSRLRWLIGRTWPVAAAALVALALTGILGEHLARSSLPGTNLDADFTWLGRRGLLVPMRGAFMFAIGLAFGALLGRTLPALLAAAAVGAALFIGVVVGIEAWRATDAVVLPFEAVGQSGIVIEVRVRAPDGRLLTFDEADAEGWMSEEVQADGSHMRPGYGEVALAVPGERYPTWVAREAAILAGLTVGGAGVAVAAVRRRRPV